MRRGGLPVACRTPVESPENAPPARLSNHDYRDAAFGYARRYFVRTAGLFEELRASDDPHVAIPLNRFEVVPIVSNNSRPPAAGARGNQGVEYHFLRRAGS